MKDKVLLKDIVIPAGTIFKEAPRKTERHGEGHFDCVIGLSDNTTGTLTYDMSDDKEILEEYFTDVK